VIALIAAWLCIPQPGAEAMQPATNLATYGYDGNHAQAAFTYDASERGPPAADNLATAYNTVDLPSSGASTRLDCTTPAATFAYDHPGRFVHTARDGHPVEERFGSCVPGSVVVDRSDVAAKTPAVGDDLLRPHPSRF
jgi:hypothetical protein